MKPRTTPPDRSPEAREGSGEWIEATWEAKIHAAQARALAEAVRALDPEHPDAHAQRALIFLATGRAELAQEESRVALQEQPKSAASYLAAGWLRLVQGDLPAAAVAAQKCLGLAPGNVDGYTLKASVFARESNVRECLGMVEVGHRLDTGNAMVALLRAVALHAAGNTADGAQALQEALDECSEGKAGGWSWLAFHDTVWTQVPGLHAPRLQIDRLREEARRTVVETLRRPSQRLVSWTVFDPMLDARLRRHEIGRHLMAPYDWTAFSWARVSLLMSVLLLAAWIVSGAPALLFGAAGGGMLLLASGVVFRGKDSGELKVMNTAMRTILLYGLLWGLNEFRIGSAPGRGAAFSLLLMLPFLFGPLVAMYMSERLGSTREGRLGKPELRREPAQVPAGG